MNNQLDAGDEKEGPQRAVHSWSLPFSLLYWHQEYRGLWETVAISIHAKATHNLTVVMTSLYQTPYIIRKE